MNYKKNHLPAGYWRDPVNLVACGFGTGASPWAPGTAGTLVGIPFCLLLAPFGVLIFCIVVLVLLIAGIWICDRAARNFSVHDHPGIVWDEVVGYLIGMIAVPVTMWTILAAFFLFRIFDIIKPYPIRVIDKKVQGGLGIMLDDVLAGVYTLICMHILLRFI